MRAIGGLPLLLLALWAACAACQSTPPSLANFSPEQQRNATQFVNQRCFPQANGLVAQIQNGFAISVPFTIVLQCQGTGNATFEQTVAPFTVSEPFLIQPASGAVANRVCSLLLTGLDPHDAAPLPDKSTFQKFTTTCGAVQVRNNDYDEDEDDDCNMFDASCEYNKGAWYYGLVPTIIHTAGLTALILIPFAIFTYISNHSTENLLIGAGSARGDYNDHLEDAVNKWKSSDRSHPPSRDFVPGSARAMHFNGKSHHFYDDADEEDDGDRRRVMHDYDDGDDDGDDDDDDDMNPYLEGQGMIGMKPMNKKKKMGRGDEMDTDANTEVSFETGMQTFLHTF